MSIIQSTKKQIRRSPYQALTAILIMSLTLLLGGLMGVFVATSSYILRYFESKPQITVFFKDPVTEDAVTKLKDDLSASEKVKLMTFISKEDALKIYKDQNKNDPLLLEMVTADILPASLEVSAVDPQYLKEIDEIVRNRDSVEEVVFQKDIIDTLLVWTNAIRIAGAVLSLLLLFVSVFTVMTVISLKIALKKDEINIQNLVGASPSYIRSPLVLEGMFYGIVGGFLAWAILFGIAIWLQPIFRAFLGSIPDFSEILSSPLNKSFLIVGVVYLLFLTTSGMIIGLMGSLIALRRFLRLLPAV